MSSILNQYREDSSVGGARKKYNEKSLETTKPSKGPQPLVKKFKPTKRTSGVISNGRLSHTGVSIGSGRQSRASKAIQQKNYEFNMFDMDTDKQEVFRN